MHRNPFEPTSRRIENMTPLLRRMPTVMQMTGFGRSTIYLSKGRSDVIGARWTELNLDAAEWEVPAKRMKVGRTHWNTTVPAADTLAQKVAFHRSSQQRIPIHEPRRFSQTDGGSKLEALRCNWAAAALAPKWHGRRSIRTSMASVRT